MINVALLHGGILLPVVALLITAATYLTMVTIQVKKMDISTSVMKRLYGELLSYTCVAWALILAMILVVFVGIPVGKMEHKTFALVMALVGIVLGVVVGGLGYLSHQKLAYYTQDPLKMYYIASIMMMVAGGVLVVYGLVVMQVGYGKFVERVEIPQVSGRNDESVKSLIDTVLSKYRSKDLRNKMNL